MLALFYLLISVMFFTWSLLGALKKHCRNEKLTAMEVNDIIMAVVSLVLSTIAVNEGWQI